MAHQYNSNLAFLFLSSIPSLHMHRNHRMNYQQEYIKDEYIELKMPAAVDASGEPNFQLDQNHLHIWPRHSFMLIALPNKASHLFSLAAYSSRVH